MDVEALLWIARADVGVTVLRERIGYHRKAPLEEARRTVLLDDAVEGFKPLRTYPLLPRPSQRVGTPLLPR